ncbi:zinc finger BED domain-containing protein RICESLEEPER 1-like [Medicago truncatula]|uniref:zinc finger BED domain-containing protein RICESLEEPER 1-like n=1 Tax=Medicago truncatula TaxID=3880 RepID=UPI0019671908|nr:zinc finger BED domain-containing protein RICESLEEPER 1-like [Medicago truncatula]
MRDNDIDSSGSHENMCVDGEIESQAREIPLVPPIDQNAQEVSSDPKDKKRKGKAKAKDKSKGKALTSDVWLYLVKVGIVDGVEKCRCKACHKLLTCESGSGTSHLKRHVRSCSKTIKNHDVGEMMIDVEGKLRKKKFDPMANREFLARIMITHGAPFNMVEWKVFREYQKFLNDDCVFVSRNTIAKEILNVYRDEKQKLKSQLAQIRGRVCLTSDCWTACSNEVGAVLDPTKKFNFLKFAYEKLDPLTSEEKLKKVKMTLGKLFSEYIKNGIPSNLSSSQVQPSYGGGTRITSSSYDEFEEYESQSSNNTGKSELDTYLDELRMPLSQEFDVLAFWKERSRRSPNLARMACDILSIPITTVASESAFSIGARVVNRYRSSMKDDSVQALLCARSWLHGFEELYDDNNDVQEDETHGSGQASNSTVDVVNLEED